jgi:hypothetical protein
MAIETAYNDETLKLLLKRGALLAAANWPVVAIQFAAAAVFQVLLAVPIIGAAVLVAVLLGADLVELLQGSLYNIFTTVARTLMSEPVALVAFVAAFASVLLGGSVLMFFLKGGTVDVLIAAHRAAEAIEREPVTGDRLHQAAQFTVPRFNLGCRRLFRPYLMLGLSLIGVYTFSCAAYLAFAFYAYNASTDRFLAVGWTLAAAIALGLLVAWITSMNLLYLLTQIAIAVDGTGVVDGVARVARFIRVEFREVAGIFAVLIGLVIAAVVVSALLWAGLGLIAFVPLVGLAVFPLQIAAWFVRGFLFEYLGVIALAAYVALYVDYASKDAEAPERSRLTRVLERPA